MTLTIGVLGTGNVGRTLGAALAARDHRVVFGVRDPASERATAARAAAPQALVDTYAGAAAPADVVILAVPHAAAPESIAAAGDLSGKIVVDATNDVQFPAADNERSPTSAAELLAPLLPGSRLVKCFNTIGWEHMADPSFGDLRADMYLCGDDATAREVVAGLARDLGFDPVDCGPLPNARLLEELAVLWIWHAVRGPKGRDVAFKLISKDR